MTKNKYFSSSRKKTPWDDAAAPSCLQSFIRDEYKDHFYMHHISLEESNEDKLVNSYIPSKCPNCLSTSFKKVVRLKITYKGINAYYVIRHLPF